MVFDEREIGVGMPKFWIDVSGEGWMGREFDTIQEAEIQRPPAGAQLKDRSRDRLLATMTTNDGWAWEPGVLPELLAAS